MFHRFAVPAFMALLLLPTVANLSVGRIWVHSAGKHSVEAEFISFKNGKVYVEETDGTIVVIAIEELSAADQRYVRLVMED